jgi:hypothetical protein
VQGNLDHLSDDVANIYERLANTISKEEFVERVNQKVEDMSGLCDDKTAAMLVAHELGIDTIVQIGQIDGQTRAMLDMLPISSFRTKRGQFAWSYGTILQNMSKSFKLDRP